MSVNNILEKARKASNISRFDRLVPPKGERGVAYWAKFVASLQTLLSESAKDFDGMRDRYLELNDQHTKVIAENAELRQRLVSTGIEVLAHKMDLPADGRTQLLEIAS